MALTLGPYRRVFPTDQMLASHNSVQKMCSSEKVDREHAAYRAEGARTNCPQGMSSSPSRPYTDAGPRDSGQTFSRWEEADDTC